VIDQLFQLGRQHIKRAAQRRNKDKRRNEQADIKMQTAKQIKHRAARCCRINSRQKRLPSEDK